MKTKGLSVLLLSVAILAACGDNTDEDMMNDMAEEEVVEEVSEETTDDSGMEEGTEEEEVVEEEVVEEEVVEEDTESEEMTMDAAEATSGAASVLLAKGEMTSFVFNETGEFNIFCEPHPVMKMIVVVEEGAETSGEVAIDIADYEFVEETITVAPGTIITWTNQDNVQHNVAIR